MPPKKDQKKEIVAAFEKQVCWKYQPQQQEIQDKAETFLTTFSNELKALIDPEKSIEQNYELLANKMGINIHPCLVYERKEESQYPALKSNDYGERFVIFSNHKIDIVTLKLLGFLTSVVKLNTIKFSNNSLEHEVPEVKKFIEKQDSLNSLYFQWNSLEKVQNRAQFFETLVRPSVNHLILRHCELGNQITATILEKIASNQESKLFSLDLYANNLTPESGEAICKFVQQSKTLQFLGISKNQLNTHAFLKQLCNSIGEIPISEEEYQTHKQKQKEREEVIQKNKKRKKGTPQEPLPFLFDLKETENGRFYVKNTTLKVLNLSSNSIKDSVNKESNTQLIKTFVENQGKDVELFLEGNNFSKKSKEIFKFYQNIFV